MLKIGWSKRDISTNKPVVIAGQMYIRISEGILDPIMLTALTIENEGDYVIFLSSDTGGIYDKILDEVRAAVKAKNPLIDTQKIVMNATHTHSAPYVGKGDITGTWGSLKNLPHDGVEITPPGEYMEFYIDMATEAVCESFENRREGYIAYGYGHATTGHSRRSVYTKDWGSEGTAKMSRTVNGHAKMYGNTNDPAFSHYEAGMDSYSNFLYTFDENKKLTGAVVNVPCPSQTCAHERLISADYWHDVREILCERHGEIFVLAQCAAAGDLCPEPPHYHKARKRRYSLKYADMHVDERIDRPSMMHHRRDIALRICDSFDEVYSWATKEFFSDIPIVHSVKTIELSRRSIPRDEYETAVRDLKEIEESLSFDNNGNTLDEVIANSKKLAAGNRCRNVISKYEEQTDSPTYSMELHVIKIGEIAFATNTFELYMDYQHRIQARSPFEQTFIVQLCGAVGKRNGTYLATKRAVWGKGYSATIYCNMVSSEGGQELVEETVEELMQIY